MKEQINFVLSEFDFETTHAIIKFMNVTWKFHDKPQSIPTIDDLQNKSRVLLEEVASSEDDEAFSEYSGLEAHKFNGIIELSFVPVRSNPLGAMFN